MIPRKHTYYFVLLLCFVLCHLTTYGQGTCSSSALAPVFSQTFGQGTSSTSKSTVPSGFTTNYTFQNSGQLADGFYIVTPLVQNSSKNDWAVGSDHTGNTNGNMFLVNAGTGGSVFFSQQVDNLCPGSKYNFSAWLANVNTTSNTLPICGSGYVYPNVTFNIKNTSGVVLASYSTGNIPLTANRSVAPNWIQYGFSFDLPSGTTSLVLEMVDAYGGQPQCGNDLAIDDILFTACTPTASVSFSTSSTVCSGTNTSVNASIINSPFTNPVYQWQKSTNGGSTWSNIGTPSNSATTFNLNNVTSGDQAMYRVLVGPDVASLSSSTCITASPGISLTVVTSPSTSVTTTSPICSGNAINLNSTTTGGVSPYTYAWTGPNGFTSTAANPIINNSSSANSGTYNLTVTASNGCSATGSANVTVNTTPSVNAIGGPKGGCTGTTISLTNATAGGVWSSSNTAVATIDQSGVVSLLTSGTTTISYTVSANGCSAVVTKVITAASVSLGNSLMECNNGVRTYSNLISNPYYVSYGNTNPGNTYLWTFTNNTTGLVETDVFKSGKTNASDYPSVQLQNGNVYTISVQYTTNDISCTATQTLYKSITLTGSISSAQDTSVCFNASNIPLHGQVSVVANSLNWYTLNGSGSFSSTNSLNTTYTPSASDKANGVVYIVFAASTTLNATGNCGSSNVSDTMALRILPDNIGTSSVQTICTNNLFQHTPSSAVAGSTYSWTSSVISGTGSGNVASGTGIISNTLINNSNSVDYVVEYTITPQYNGCTATSYTVRVNVKPQPQITITNNSNNICTGSSTNISFASTVSNTQYTWTSTILSGVASGNSNNATPTTGNSISNTLVNSGTSNATVRYTITGITPSGCSSQVTTDVVIYPAPSTANAGTDQSICNASSASLSATIPASGTGSWTLVSGPNTPTFTNPANAATTVTGLTIGTYVFRWTISNGVCISTQDEVTITNSALTVPGSLTANLTVCAPVNSGVLTLSGYTGSIIHWEYSVNGGSSWNNSAITTASYSFSNLTATTQFRANVQNGACSVEISNTGTVTVQQPPSTANAGSDQTINGISSATLSANNPNSGIGSWSQLSGPNTAVFTNINQYNTSVTGLAVGTYTFRWNISNGVCTNSSDDMVIVVEPATVAGTLTADATVCATGGNGATLQLSGYTGSILQWEYSTNNGSTWSVIANNTDQYTYSNLTTTTLYRVLVQSGTGTPAYSSIVTITVMQPVTTANAGTDQTLCNQTVANLLANQPTSGNGLWSFVSGPSTANFSNNNAYNTSISGLSVGTYELKWTIANGVCPASEDNVRLTIVPPTIPGTLSSDAIVCATSNSGTLTLSSYTGAIVQTEYSINNGSSWNIVTGSAGNNSINYNNLSTTTLYRTQLKNSVCNSEYSNTVTITVLSSVTTANAGADQTLCAINSVTLAGNQPVSGTGTWTQVSGPSTANFINSAAYNTIANGLVAGTYQFRWTISNGVCNNSSDDVTIHIDPSTIAGNVLGSTTVCSDGNSGTLLLTAHRGAIIEWASSTDNGNNWTVIANNTNSISYNNLTSTTAYRAQIKSGVCNAAYSTMATIQVDPVTNPGTLSGSATVCNGNNSGIITLNGNNGNIVRWEYSTNGGTSWNNIANTSNTYTYSNLTQATIFRVLVKNGVCSNAYSNQVNISIDPITIPGTTSGAATVCYGNNTGLITLSGNNGVIQYWEYSVDGGSNWTVINQQTATLSYTNLTQTTAYRASVKSGVCTPAYSSSVTITVIPLSVGGTVSSNATVCSGNNSGTLLLSGHTGSIIGWQYSTDGGNNWNAITNTANSYSYSNITTTTQYRAIVQNGVCSQTYSSPAIITVDAPTNAGSITDAATACSGNNSGTIQLTGNNGVVVRWESSTDNGVNWTNVNNNTNTYNYSNLTATTQFRALVQNGTCSSAYTNSITIQIVPVIINTISSTSYTVCDGQSVNINASSPTGGTGTYTYQWQISTDGTNWSNISGATNIDYNFVPVHPQTLLRRVVNSTPCSSTSNTITVTKQAALSNNSLNTSIDICTGNTAQIIGSDPSGGDGIYYYQWETSTDGGNSWSIINGAKQKDYTTLNLTANQQYRRIVTTQLCTGAQSSTSNSINIVVRPNAIASVSITTNTGCTPFNVTSSNIQATHHASNNVSYEWFANGTSIGTGINFPGYTLPLNQDQATISLKANSLYNCNAAIAEVIVYGNHPANPSFTVSDTLGCGPMNITLNNTTTSINNYSYNWYLGQTLISSNQQAGTILLQPSVSGLDTSYTITLKASSALCGTFSFSKTVTVHAKPKAAFSLNAPDFCVGDTVRIHNQSTYSNRYTWSFSDGTGATIASPVLVYKSAGIIQATLIAGTSYAPDNKACYDTISSPIQVVGIRKGSMKITSMTDHCLPHQIQATNLNTPAANVVWNWGDGRSSNGDTATHFYHKNGSYTLTMLSTSLGGCQFRDTTKVIVNSPSGSMEIQSLNLCVGQSAFFNTMITDDRANEKDSLLWHTGDGAIIKRGLSSFSYTYQKAGVYYPKVFLVKANGCMTQLASNDSIKVDQVVSKFGLSAVFECGNTNFHFIDSSKAFFGIRSWKWSIDGKEHSFERLKVANFKQKGTHSATLEVESNIGCTSNFEASFDVQVYQYPVANINAMAEACKTDLIQLKSNVSSQDSVVMRFWNLGNGSNARDSIVNATYTNEGKYNIKLVVATVNQCYDSVFKAVTVHPLPKISIDQNKIVCRGDSVTIRANGASRFIWKDQNENVLCTNCTEIKVKPNSSAGYQVIGYNEFGCTEIRSTNVRVINPLKMVASPGDTLCIGDSKTLFVTGAANYSWLSASGITATNNASVIVKPTETTTYKVVGKDAYNCFTDTAAIKVVVGKPTLVSLGRDTTITSGINYQLNVQSTNNDIVKWRWSGSTSISCITCPTPVVKLRDDACISCTVVNRYGCVSTDTVCIKTICPTTEVFVPNAFTPDGDGINDKLIIQGKGIRLIKSLRIFNRWGEVVFEKTNFNPGDPAYGWDGRIRGNNASPDVYVYMCEVICEKGLPSLFKGNTAILK